MATTPNPIATPPAPAAPTPVATPPVSTPPNSAPVPPDPAAVMRATLAQRLSSVNLPVPAALTSPAPGTPEAIPTPITPSAAPTPAPVPASPAASPSADPSPSPATPPAEPAAQTGDNDEFVLRDPSEVPPADPATAATPTSTDPASPPAEPSPAEKALQDLASLSTTDPSSFPDPDGFNDKIRGAFLATNRGRQILSHMKGMAELAKPPDQGGLGILPTPDLAKSWYQSHTHLSDLTSNLESGDPAQASQALRNLFTAPDPLDPAQTILRPGLETAADQIFNELATLSRAAQRPDIYRRAVAPVHDAKFSAMIDWVKTNFPGGVEGSEAQQWRDVVVAAVQKLAPFWGKQLTAQDFDTKPTDPAARLVEENQRLRQTLQTQEQSRANAAWNDFLDGIGAVQAPRLNSYVDQALQFVSAKYEPPVYNSLAAQFKSQCVDDLTHDPHYLRETEPILNRVRQTGAFLNGHSQDLIQQLAQIQDRHLQRIVTYNRQRFANSLRGENSAPSTPSSVVSATGGGGGQPGQLTPAQQQAQALAATHASGGPTPSAPAPGGGILQQPERFSIPRGQDARDAIAAHIRGAMNTARR